MTDQLTLPPEPTPPPAPIAVVWWIAPTAVGSHAFYSDGAFPRSVCRAERWSTRWAQARDDDPRCPDCEAAIAANAELAS